MENTYQNLKSNDLMDINHDDKVDEPRGREIW